MVLGWSEHDHLAAQAQVSAWMRWQRPQGVNVHTTPSAAYRSMIARLNSDDGVGTDRSAKTARALSSLATFLTRVSCTRWSSVARTHGLLKMRATSTMGTSQASR